MALDVLIFRDEFGVPGSGLVACQSMCDAFNVTQGEPGYYVPRAHQSNHADPSIPAPAMAQGEYHCVDCTDELIAANGVGSSICRALTGEGCEGNAPDPSPPILVDGVPIPGVAHAGWGW